MTFDTGGANDYKPRLIDVGLGTLDSSVRHRRVI